MSSREKGSRRAHFTGLWLRRPRAGDFHRSAILFAREGNRNYVVRINLRVLSEDELKEYDEEEMDWFNSTSTSIWLCDYRLYSDELILHPRGWEPDVQVAVQWRYDDDGALVWTNEEGTEHFFPSSLVELYSLGFSRDVVEEVLDEIDEKGWRYNPLCSVPNFPQEGHGNGAE